jgi:enoyl-CoA hydratase/carnithine racemase
MSELEVSDRDGARWIVFNRPDTLNAFQYADLVDAAAAVDDAVRDRRTIVFGGAGQRAFSAGMNLDLFLSVIDSPARTRETMTALQHLLDRVRQAEVPTIAAINGHCLGAAFELTLVCDFRVAVTNAKLGLPEMKLGLPCILDSAILAQYVGLSMAKEMILTGRLYDAPRLREAGLLEVVAGQDELTKAVSELLRELGPFSNVGIASQKRLFEIWQNNGLQRANDLSIDEIVRVFGDADTRATLVGYSEQTRRRKAHDA